MPGTSSDKVFISYRQTHDEQRQRVREFALKLQGCGIEVILDQLYLDAHPGGPPEGWDKWSSDQALNTDIVIIIGTKEWFQCFEKTQPPGTGLGAACEADDLRHRIYKANGIIENIRVVIFEDADASHISAKLERYHRFNAERDFTNIVRWLGGTVSTTPAPSSFAPHSDVPNNLPRILPFFGREKELGEIVKALDPKSRTWGTLIDGDGGMGKTTLAVRAAYDCPLEHFDRIVFVSLKQHEMDDQRLRSLGSFALSSWSEMLNEMARELGLPEVAKSPEKERARMLRDALSDHRILFVLDNLETLSIEEQDELFAFLNVLPTGCKALLTSRVFTGNKVLALDLKQLDQPTALRMLEEIAGHNAAFAKSAETERIQLYEATGGNPLLLRWTAAQVGSGPCTSIRDALDHLRSRPPEQSPLAFIFDHVVDSLSATEVSLLVALTWPSQAIPVEAITEIAGTALEESRTALKFLTNRSLVIPDQKEKHYRLVPLVADFLRNKKPEVIAATGSRLEQRALELIFEHGFRNYDRFPLLEAAWPSVVPALPLLLTGPNDRLQEVCNAIGVFLDYTGRYDEKLAFSHEAEGIAVAAEDYESAGWRACAIGWMHSVRDQADEVLACSDRALVHWQHAFPPGSSGQAGIRERAIALQLRGRGHAVNEEYSAAIAAFRAALKLHYRLSRESLDVADILDDLAEAEVRFGNFDLAERNYCDALSIARAANSASKVAAFMGGLAWLKLQRDDWASAEALAREALLLAEKLCHQEWIATNHWNIAIALVGQGRGAEGLPHAHLAVEVFTRLGLGNDIARAQETLEECEKKAMKDDRRRGLRDPEALVGGSC